MKDLLNRSFSFSLALLLCVILGNVTAIDAQPVDRERDKNRITSYGMPAELTIRKVTDHSVRITLKPEMYHS